MQYKLAAKIATYKKYKEDFIMKKMLIKANALLNAVIEKVSNHLSENEKERVAIGTATCATGIILYYMIAFWNLDNSLFSTFVSAICFLIGLVLITNSFKKTEKILQVLGKESILLLSAFMAALLTYMEVNRFMSNAYGSFDFILFIIGSIVFIAYALRLGMWLFSMMKKLVNGIVEKLKSSGTELEAQSKTWSEVLKNLVSIAGTLAIIANFLLPYIVPVINKLFGIE